MEGVTKTGMNRTEAPRETVEKETAASKSPEKPSR